MIFDCFPFHNELDLLEIRLEELKEVVDWFILVEGNTTYSGSPKPFVFEANRERFADYNICHIKINQFPVAASPWHYEIHTRNSLIEGLNQLQANSMDVILLSDIDEIPRGNLVAQYAEQVERGELTCCVFQQSMYGYYVNCRSRRKWHGTRMIRRDNLSDFHALRTMVGAIISDGGWHFRYMGGINRVQQQLAASVHCRRYNAISPDPAAIAHRIYNLAMPGEEQATLEIVLPEASLPKYLREHSRRFQHLILPGGANAIPQATAEVAFEPLFPEVSIHPHRIDVNPDVLQFSTREEGTTEKEYLNLLNALVGIFKPTHLFETGTWYGDGTIALLLGSGPGATVWSLNDTSLPEATIRRLEKCAKETGNDFHFVPVHTKNLIEHSTPMRWRDITKAKATFAFLDTTIPQRAMEFEYISNPMNEVLDFTRPVCVCIHDMSRYRHPFDTDTQFLAQSLQYIEKTCQERGWQQMRLHQSRGLYIMTKYPHHAGIDGRCIVPQELVAEEDIHYCQSTGDNYLITDYYPVLADLVRKKRPRTILEIGIRYGYSLAVMLDATPTIEQVFAFDMNESPGWGGKAGAYPVGQQNLEILRQRGRWPNLRSFRFFDCNTQMLQHLPVEPHSIDLASVDGDHSPEGCLHDFDLVLPYIAPGGILVADDALHCDLYPHMAAWAEGYGFPYRFIPDSSGRGRIVISPFG